MAIARTGLLLAACFGLSFLLGSSLPQLLQGTLVGQVIDAPAVERAEKEVEGQLNILLLGIDARKGETQTRTDTIMLARIDADQHKVAVVSIPRDTRVEVPGSPVPKINAANAVGGPELACRVVGELMGCTVDYYVLTNFEGFKDIIDTLGGVTIDVERRMYKPSEDINLRKGVQRLDGRNALAYVRFRDYPLGDIDRTSHQQKFLKALAEEMFQGKTILKLPRLVPQIARCVQTNMSLPRMVALAYTARNFSTEDLHVQTLPGYFYTRNGVSYWAADEKKARTILDDLLAGKSLEVVEGEIREGGSSSHSHAAPAPARQPSDTGPVTGAGGDAGTDGEDAGSPPPEETAGAPDSPPADPPAPAVPAEDIPIDAGQGL